MPARSRRPEILTAYETILARYGANRSTVGALALELVKAAENRGIDFDRPALIEDPVISDWREPPTPGDAAAGLARLRREAGLDPKEPE